MSLLFFGQGKGTKTICQNLVRIYNMIGTSHSHGSDRLLP
jgi:hypothetical protein